MPEVCSPPKTIEDLILDILADEAQIIRCLRIFFCKTLQEIETEKCMIPERKVKLASDLINAAAQKEAALAAVLEAISKFEEGQDEFITLVPGAIYQVTSSSSTIQTITFMAKTDVGVAGGQISAIYDGEAELSSSGMIDEVPANYNIPLGGAFNPDDITLQNTGTVTVHIANVVTS